MLTYCLHLLTPSNLLRYLPIIKRGLIWVIIPLGIYLGYLIVQSPLDYQQKEHVKILYIHVPFASLALSLYIVIACLNVIYILWRSPLAIITSLAIARVGVAFAFLTLVTGSLWGKPTWGTYWVWDARLTSMFFLFLIYIAYIGLIRNYYPVQYKQYMLTSYFGIMSVMIIPIIKFSVTWWNTLHQPNSLLTNPKSIHPDMLYVLIISFVFFLLLTALLVVKKLNELLLVIKQKGL